MSEQIPNIKNATVTDLLKEDNLNEKEVMTVLKHIKNESTLKKETVINHLVGISSFNKSTLKEQLNELTKNYERNDRMDNFDCNHTDIFGSGHIFPID